jgi:hypothetical protein
MLSYAYYFYRVTSDNFDIPAMYIDTTLSPLMGEALLDTSKTFFKHLTSRSVSTGHWAMIEDPQSVNKHIKEWIEQVVYGGKQAI